MSKANILPQKDFVEKLKGEYADILREELKKKGYESDHILENDKLIIAYCTLFERRVRFCFRASVAPVHMRAPFMSTPMKFISGYRRANSTVYSPLPQPNSSTIGLSL